MGWKAVSALPGPLPPLSWPDLSVDTVRSLFGAMLVMTLLGLTEAAAIARAVARKNKDTLDGNQEFIGQGLANLAGSFFAAMPSSGSFNRSGVNVESGARTPLAAASTAVFLVLLLSFVAPLVVTLIATVTLSLEWAILLGITSALIARRLSR